MNISSDRNALQSLLSPLNSVKKLGVAIAAVVLVVCVALGLTGCKPPAGQLAANAVIAEMAAIEKHDPESLDFLIEVSQAQQLEQIGISQQEFFAWWLDGFAYSLGDVEMNIDEDEAQVEAKITCRQLEPIIRTWSNEYVEWLLVNSEAIKSGELQDPCAYGRDLLKSMFENTEPTLVETTIAAQKIDDTWSVVGDAQNGLYHDALLGSVDNLEGYYLVPLEELDNLGVTLPVSAPGSEQASDEQSE